MSEKIAVEKRVVDKSFSQIVDTQFRQLVNRLEDNNQEVTIEEFFQLYEELFYSIPKEGEINSHQYILQREADYLGVRIAEEIDVQALLNEITELRQELLEANKILNENNVPIVNI